MKETPFCIRNTNGFLKKIKIIDYVPDETFPVAVDFRVLCTNIPTFWGIVATKRALDKKTDKAVPTNTIITFIVLILALNPCTYPCDSLSPSKMYSLVRTHKVNNLVRIITNGCNTAVENLSIFVEKVFYKEVERIPSTIKDTSHMLDIIDNLMIVLCPKILF